MLSHDSKTMINPCSSTALNLFFFLFFVIIIASFTPRVYCHTRSEAFAYELALEVLWAHTHSDSGALSLFFFCRGRINLISLQRIISKTSNNEILEVQKNRKAIRSFLNKSHLSFFFLPLFAISSCSPPPTMPRRPSRAPPPHPSSLHPTPLRSFHCPAHVLNLPDENRSHCSATIEWLMQERWTLMDFFFFFFSMCSRLKLRPDLQM